ncbi:MULTISPECIES: PRC-barrel domain containing protein [Halomonadaceae]|uniref:PRC-barrel domain-containing protein n=1 Tax=Onishia taeanensis TaxID=284577 RepID=A0A328XT20_9GAMM|nr:MULTISPECIES: PRC-barrel domain containing protein [Halomonas]RAR63291.1 hypothetical protein BCL93_10218 [Halomonas taeanensis]
MTARKPLSTNRQGNRQDNRKGNLKSALFGAMLIGGMSVAGSALAAPQGLYSANELNDADVVLKATPSQHVGEVDDILLDDDMRVRALVIETDDQFGLAEKAYVINTGDFTVETLNGDRLDQVSYVVHLDMTSDEISQQPEYTSTWWAQTKEATSKAWANTKEGASSAWETTKSATADALTSAGNALESAGEKAQQAVDSNQ